MRVCRTCEKELPDSAFHVRENGRFRTECGACVYQRVKRWREQNPESYREMQRRKKDKVRDDPIRRAREREMEKARRRARSRVGETRSTTCKRCGEDFEYEFIRKPREVCDLCRRHDADWKTFRLSGPAARELRARGACDICGTTENPGGRFNEFHIDHCHGTRKVRGLLCVKCNTVLGLMGDDPARLRAAADYLEAQ